jgi:magnesium-transporting ATPase (P-type)
MTVGAKADTSTVKFWHAIPAVEVVEELATSVEKGLDAAEAANRHKRYGPNRLPEGKKRGPFMRFLTQFNNVLVYVLLGAGFTKLMLSLWVDAAIIFAVVVLNALLGFIQEDGPRRHWIRSAQHAVCGGAYDARRRKEAHTSRSACSRRHRLAIAEAALGVSSVLMGRRRR